MVQRHSRDFGPGYGEGRYTYRGDGGDDSERPVGELVAEAVQQGQRLVREEVHLAKIELRNEVERVRQVGTSMALGGTLLMASVYLFLFGICFAFGAVIPLWLSAFIVGAITAGVGYFLVKGGIARARAMRVSRQETVDTIKENLPWKSASAREHGTISRTQGNA
ncbi:MAG: phage holin family protein [Myxococcota bacterium]